MSNLNQPHSPTPSSGPTIDELKQLVAECIRERQLPSESEAGTTAISNEKSLASLLDVPLNPFSFLKQKSSCGPYVNCLSLEDQNLLKEKLLAVLALAEKIKSKWSVELLPMGILSSTIEHLHQEIIDRKNPSRYPAFIISIEHIEQPDSKTFRLWFDNSCSKLLQVTLNGESCLVRYSVTTQQDWNGGAFDEICFTGSEARLRFNRFPQEHHQMLREAWTTLFMSAITSDKDIHFSGDPSRLALPNHSDSDIDLSRNTLRGFYRLDPPLPLSQLERGFKEFLDGATPGSQFFNTQATPAWLPTFIDRELSAATYANSLHRVRSVDPSGIPLLTSSQITAHSLETLSQAERDKCLKSADLKSHNLAKFISELMSKNSKFAEDVAFLSVSHALYHLQRAGALPIVSNETINEVFAHVSSHNGETILKRYLEDCRGSNPILLTLSLVPEEIAQGSQATCARIGLVAIAIMYELLTVAQGERRG
jgi:hypothetical protein